jgi:hypothetical protein
VAYVACVGACPVAADGNAEAGCVASCPQPDSSAAVQLKDDYEVCRTHTANCAECGHIVDKPHPFDGQNCTPVMTGDACGECVLANCCEVFDTCSNSSECLAYEDCVSACPSGLGLGQCIIDCQMVHPEGALLSHTDTACWDSRCGAECNGFWNDCETCKVEHCDLEQIACDTNLECTQAKLCGSDCLNDPACSDWDYCLATLSTEAYEIWNTERVCIAQNCSDFCK